jgi:hypothetical protein
MGSVPTEKSPRNWVAALKLFRVQGWIMRSQGPVLNERLVNHLPEERSDGREAGRSAKFLASLFKIGVWLKVVSQPGIKKLKVWAFFAIFHVLLIRSTELVRKLKTTSECLTARNRDQCEKVREETSAAINLLDGWSKFLSARNKDYCDRILVEIKLAEARRLDAQTSLDMQAGRRLFREDNECVGTYTSDCMNVRTAPSPRVKDELQENSGPLPEGFSYADTNNESRNPSSTIQYYRARSDE